MKKLFFILLACVSLTISAKPAKPETFSFQFSDVLFPELLKVVYSEVLQRSYVIDTDVLKSDDILTLHIKQKPASDIEAYIQALLEKRGLAVIRKGTIDIITKKEEIDQGEKHILVYRPRFRSVEYLNDLASSFFPKGLFSGQRQISNVQPMQTMNQPGNYNPSNAPQMPQPQDTGTSAYSMIDKTKQDAIVFYGSERDTTRLEALLTQLDKPTPELLVKAVVYEVRTDKTEGSALNLAAAIISGRFGISIDAGVKENNSIKIKFNDFTAIYSALSNDQRFKLVSSPTMRVQSGQSARFIAGAEVPVLGAVTYPSQGQAVQNIEYKSSGVILDLKPTAREDTTDLSILQQISSFTQTTNGVNESPTLLKREIRTHVSAKPDEMIILGGLEESQHTESNQGLSFLPNFMRSNTEDEVKTEIMMILQMERI